MKFTLTILALVAICLAQDTTSSSSTRRIPGPMEQSITQLSGTRDASATSPASDDSSSTSSHFSAPRPMEQSLTTSATDSSSTASDSSTADSSASPTTTSSETSASAGGVGQDATRTGVSQSQDTSAADALLAGVRLEQVVMLGMGLGAALAV